MSWVKVSASKYAHISDLEKASRCQLELAVKFVLSQLTLCAYNIVRWTDIELQPFKEDAPQPPLRILSFDIECLGRDNIFPQPEMDPVIQIGNVVSILGI
jgi:DNA polymerase delta subunit 1